ncbi:type II toxin-antitoxin system VapC family toxin [Candidatus Bathyarchaeota archaeon]|nr:type II toxin-antitoxin system VapC family toxin [Candidatus Bathyarchaeota archaeon]
MDKGGQGAKPKIVVDASVVVKWIIPGEPWEEQARAVGEKIVSGEVEAYAPHILSYEVASAILKSILIGAIKSSDGIEALEALESLGISVQTTEWGDLKEILRLAVATKLTIYDSAYLHLTKKIGAKLITADSQLKQKGENVAEIILLKDLEPVKKPS